MRQEIWMAGLLCVSLASVGPAGACAPPEAGYAPSLAAEGRSGQPLALAWTDPWAATEGCTGAQFLVLALPEESRIAGSGALVIRPGDQSPFGIGWRKDELRAFIPIDDPRGAAGTLDLLPYLVGTLRADWALVHIDADRRETILTEDALLARIAPGTPDVVVFDAATTELPLHTVTSQSGEFEMEVFATHYRVRDARTGAPIHEGEGLFPAFSPTSRFVHAFRPEPGRPASEVTPETLFADLDVIDLKAGVPALTLTSGGFASRGDFITGLLWSPGDSYLVLFFEGNGVMAMKPMLTDGALWGDDFDCGACWPWERGVAVIDPDRGYAFLGAGQGNAAVSLYFPQEFPAVDPAILGRTGANVDPPQPLWDLLGPPRASYLDPDAAALAPGLPLVLHPSTDGPAPLPLAADTDRASRAAVALAGADLSVRGESRMADRLADLGLTAQPVHDLAFAQIPSEAGRWYEALPETGEYPPDPEHWILPGGYYFDTGRAALEAGLASTDEARRLTALAGQAMDQAICVVSRAHTADVWTYRSPDGALTQLLHIYCRVGTGYEAEGVLHLLRLDATGDHLTLLAAADEYGASGEDGTQTAPLPLEVAVQLPLAIRRVAAERLAILGTDGRLAVLDAVSGGAVLTLAQLPAPELVARLSLTETGNHLLQELQDGQFHVYSALDGARLFSGKYLDDEVVVLDTAFRFDATPEGAGYVALRFPGDPRLYTLDQLGARLRTPGLVAEVLTAGRVTARPALPEALPPRLTLLGEGARGGSLSLRAEASGVLAVIELFRDGIFIARQPVSGQRADLALNVPLLPETRWISARAVDAVGLTSALVELPVDAGEKPPVGRLMVLAVGIDDFTDPALPDLNFAISDAQRFSDAAREAGKAGRYNSVEVEILSPKAPLAVALPQRIAALSAVLHPEDTLMVFLATHGVVAPAGSSAAGALFLADGQTRVAALQQTALGMAQLSVALSRVPARVIVFVDACHSGAPDAATNEDLQQSLADGAARVAVVAASKERQVSLEGARLGGGAFTTAIVRALRTKGTDLDGNGAIELAELYVAVKRDVVLSTEGRQTPWIARLGFVGEVPLF